MAKEQPPMAAKHGDGRNGLAIRDAFYILGLVTLVVTILTLAANPLAPIALAILLWFLINAIAQGMRDAPGIGGFIPEWLALTLASVVTVSGIIFAGRLVISNLSELGDGLRGIDVKAAETIATIEAALGVSLGIDIPEILADLKLSDFIGQIANVLTTTASNISAVLLFVLFLLFDQPFFKAKIRALFPDSDRRAHVQKVLERIGRDTRIYIWLMTIVSLLVGFLTYAICAFFGLKGAVFWGFLAFALNFIPTIGSFAGVLFPAAFALVQFDALEDTAAFVISLAVVQFVMGNLLLPRLTGDRLNLSEFVVVLSLLVWGAMWGVAGMFLAVPLMMVLAIVLAQFDSTRPVAILLSKNGRVGLY